MESTIDLFSSIPKSRNHSNNMSRLKPLNPLMNKVTHSYDFQGIFVGDYPC